MTDKPGLFISLYCDEDVSAVAAAMVRARQFDVVTTFAAGMAGSDDLSQLRYATSQRRTLLTHNIRDFVRLDAEYRLRREEHCGIILAVRRTPSELAGRIALLMNQVSADEMFNALRYV